MKTFLGCNLYCFSDFAFFHKKVGNIIHWFLFISTMCYILLSVTMAMYTIHCHTLHTLRHAYCSALDWALCIMQWAPAPLWHCWDAITRHELEPTQIIQLLWEAITELSLIRVLLTHCSPAFPPMITFWQQSLSNCDRRLVKKWCKVIFARLGIYINR